MFHGEAGKSSRSDVGHQVDAWEQTAIIKVLPKLKDMAQQGTITPTDKNIRISGKLAQLFPPDEDNPRCSIELVDIEWALPGAPQLEMAIIKFQCCPRDKRTGNELQFDAFDSLLDSKVALEYTGTNNIKGKQVEIKAMFVSLIS